MSHEKAKLHAASSQFAQFLKAIVNVHRCAPWRFAKEDVFLIVQAMDLALRNSTRKKAGNRFKLEIAWTDEVTVNEVFVGRVKLELVDGAERTVLDRFQFSPGGQYPIQVLTDPKGELQSADALSLRIMGHFGDPKSGIVKLLSECME